MIEPLLTFISSISYKIFLFQLSLNNGANEKEILPSSLIDPAAGMLSESLYSSLRIKKLKELLRKTPWWQKGHLLLAIEAFKLNDIATSYASANAVLVLNSKGSTAIRAREILGESYLKRGAYEEAKKIFESLETFLPKNIHVKENLAAAYLGLGNPQKVEELLSRIPEDKLQAETKAVLEYARRKGVV